MQSTSLPAFYDDLDATCGQALSLLARGVKDRRAAAHTPTIATLGLDGRPRLRTVVNRGFDSHALILRFHTDRRSAKVHELRHSPQAAVQVYDADLKVQLRLDATATIHDGDDLCRQAWAATRDFSRACYRVITAPGNRIDDPGAVPFREDGDLEAGVENFVAVTLKIFTLEWLYLAHQGHRRARFSWTTDGSRDQQWLVP